MFINRNNAFRLLDIRYSKQDLLIKAIKRVINILISSYEIVDSQKTINPVRATHRKPHQLLSRYPKSRVAAEYGEFLL